jgi:uncharacterized protein (DUF2267 family)
MDARTFIRQVADRLCADARRAEAVIAVVFHELRDRLTPADGAAVTAQLPRGLKRLWAEPEPPDTSGAPLYRMELFGEVMQNGALPDSMAAEGAVVAVFASLRCLLGSAAGKKEGAPRDIVDQLPRDLEMLWRKAAAGEHADLAPAGPRARHFGPRRARTDKHREQARAR